MVKFRSTDLTPISRLGAGQFGTVFLAADELHGKVAVKVIARKATELDTPWGSRRDALLAEGQRLKQAEHPNVVRVFDVRESDSGTAVLLLMEYLSGGSCDQRYRAGPVNIDHVRRILSDVALGLSAIHARGMLHRDIKPANILLTADGQAKVSDFGLVTDELVSGYAAAAGYLDHLAIEYHKTRKTSIRTDMWAVGMTAYRIIHGRAYYESMPRPVTRVPDGRFAANLPWLPHVPDSWRRFVRKLMHDDPGRRIQNADELFAAVSKLPSTPAWDCDYAPGRVAWQRLKGRRVHSVVWDRPNSRSQTWVAKSLPVDGLGREIRLAGSSSGIGGRQAEKELKKFFQE